MESAFCIGIDGLDLSAYPTGQSRRFKTTPAGLRSLSRYCRDAQPRLIAFEASGGYERPLADTLTQAKLPTNSARRRRPRPLNGRRAT